MKNFVLISLSPWDIELGSNSRDIALELSKNHKVLYVNIPLKRSELISGGSYTAAALETRKQVIKGKQNGLKNIKSNLWQLFPDVVIEPINRLKPNFLFNLFNNVNAGRFAKAIEKAIQELGFRDYILINDNDIYNGVNLKKHLSAEKYVYYLRDKLSAMPYWAPHAGRVESKLIESYDLTLTNSTYLEGYARKFNQNSYYVGQGCDLTIFQEGTESLTLPEDMVDIKRPIIGYAGALNSQRLDIDLIHTMSKDNPQWSFVYVGKPDQGFRNHDFTDTENLYFLGHKKLEELPGYLNSFDVCINPQSINELTIGNYPRKIDEYLAMGKAVVATKTLAMEPFKDFCFLGEGYIEYKGMISEALETDTDELKSKRKAFANDHSWENSVNKMLSYIE